MNAVTVKNLTRVFRQGDEEIRAVDHVSFTVAPGEMVAIVGQSGSGKTALLNLIGGIEHPTSGSVEVDGADICAADDETLSKIRRRKLGYIFQDFNLIPILTAEENIIMREAAQDIPAAGPWTCPACGGANTGKFCEYCGSPRP